MTMTYQRIAFRETDDEGNVFYVAHHPELPGCVSQGSTMHEAINSLGEARALYLDCLAAFGIKPPAPEVWCGNAVIPVTFP